MPMPMLVLVPVLLPVVCGLELRGGGLNGTCPAREDEEEGVLGLSARLVDYPRPDDANIALPCNACSLDMVVVPPLALALAFASAISICLSARRLARELGRCIALSTEAELAPRIIDRRIASFYSSSGDAVHCSAWRSCSADVDLVGANPNLDPDPDPDSPENPASHSVGGTGIVP